jgi:hypothetical protein
MLAAGIKTPVPLDALESHLHAGVVCCQSYFFGLKIAFGSMT